MNLYNYFTIYFKNLKLNIPDEEIYRFSQIFSLKKLKKGDFFVREGDITPHMAFIKSGLVRFYYIDSKGKELNQTFHREHSFVMNYNAAFKQIGSPFYIQALEDCEIISGNYKEFESFYDIHPCWDRMVRILVTENFMIKAKREQEFLLYDTKHRYEHFLSDRHDVAPRLSQYHIAMYLGVNPSSLNRIIKQAKKESSSHDSLVS
ncbi:Crp/Fnr family transcriptional regulator [Bacteriovoracaceae bacterium]|nr:Crp/Fnr family transcriptional regulator [Bacteriovoracaceae bacterium]